MDKINTEHKHGNPWLMCGVGVFLVIVVGVMATPVVMKSSRKSALTTTISNAKQIFYLMVEFDGDYNEFPSDATAVLDSGKFGEPDRDLRSFKGKYSNDYLGQFIAAGYTENEDVFVAPWEKDSGRKADNVISPRERILEAGECNFSYIKNQSTSDNSGRPLLLAPMAGEGLTFDPEIYDGKAVVLSIDGAVKQLLIDRESHLAKIGGVKTMFEGGQDSVWSAEGLDPSNLVHPKPWPRHLTDSLFIEIGSVVVVLLILVIVCIARSRRKRRSMG